ncbi:hypothetical protein FAZ95_14020 [Trinickia violacea]|uniref:HEPN domain-containing protein n=1 Tax=Trinickia violacea TaxID=2571746 RepID=A0A4P8IWK1_9BURK|nr:hypothetical protein [Trinickia violacea]QCP50199.1 hypothetical protein FAZ95_14020 [Trinickia violacea]
MSSTPRQLVDCAAAMLQGATDEPQFRAICSRAYYAAFHAANEFHNALPAPGSVGNANGRHEQLIAQLANPQISKNNKRYHVSQALSKSLRPLIAARVLADYEIHLSVDAATAASTVTGADTLITKAV